MSYLWVQTIDAVGKNEYSKVHHYGVEVRTELGENEIVSVTAVDEHDAEDLAPCWFLRCVFEIW